MDLYLRFYFLKIKKEVDSLDREAIVEFVYTLMSYKGYLNAICRKPMTWESRLDILDSDEFYKQVDNEALP